MKKLITFFTLGCLLSAALLWFTKESVLQSQSMYFDQPNRVWYIMMHVCIIMTFFLLNSKYSKWYGIVAFSSLLTLGLDVSGFPVPHNAATAVLFISACWAVIQHGGKELRWLHLICCSIGAIFFLSGLFGLLGDSGIFFGESIAEIFLSLSVMVNVWVKKDLVSGN